MQSTGSRKESIPEFFLSYEDAGEFWDTHDSSEYLDQMRPVKVDAKLERRYFEVEIDEYLIIPLKKYSESHHIPSSKLVNTLLREKLAA